MTDTRNRKTASILGCLACAMLVVGCSNSGQDVRVVLCKDLTQEAIGRGDAITWLSAVTEMRRGEHLTVTLGFRVGERATPSQSACSYRYNAVDETALTVANPAAAYSTSPESMTLDGRAIRNPALASLVRGAMAKQGREFIERAQHGVEDAAKAVRDRLTGAESPR